MYDVEFQYGEYDNLDGFWVEVIVIGATQGDNQIVITGGHFNTKKEVFKFYLQSKKYFGKRLLGKVEI